MEIDCRPEIASLDKTATAAPALVCQLPLCDPDVLLVMTGFPESKLNAIVPAVLDNPDVAADAEYETDPLPEGILKLHGLAHEYGVLMPLTVMFPLMLTEYPCGSDAVIATLPLLMHQPGLPQIPQVRDADTVGGE
jgi:hypothetical protein